MDAAEFARIIRKAGTPEDRIAWFGALLAREARKPVEVVGGSAIEIYLSSASYVSQAVDLVGDPAAIESVLRRWGFRQLEGRSGRTYWTDQIVGLVDLVGLADRSGLSPHKVSTPFGPVTLSAPEPLIIRRLMRADRENSVDRFRQAVALARIGNLDWEYLQSEARYEKVEPALRRLRKLIQT
ncbi:MAG: hypothetical protein L3K15_04220 [Thermoplasmata archaeon]|nr:hypothetical protein [Thermoplasmata archaeon]